MFSRFHKEGKITVRVGLIFVLVIEFWLMQLLRDGTISLLYFILNTLVIFAIYGFFAQFFRNPTRTTQINENHIIAPVDGKVVIIEPQDENEYFKKKCLQISVFMSPLNVHVTRYPISGRVIYSKYHKGKYLVAWHPKSSTLNERTTVVIEDEKKRPLLYRQIAGAVARRIINYAKEEGEVTQGEDSGFIKFGSRLDILVPYEVNVKVNLNDKVRGGETILATFE